MRQPFFNVSFRRVGGIRFLRIGHFQVTFCMSRKAFPHETAARHAADQAEHDEARAWAENEPCHGWRDGEAPAY